MLYFITSVGLVSEEKVLANSRGFRLKPLNPFIEIPIMKNLNVKDLNMGMYDFSNDIKYYLPAIVDNVIVRNITKSIYRIGNYTPTILYRIRLQWFSVENKISGERWFLFNHIDFHFEDFFSKVIPFINRCIRLKDGNLTHHIIVVSRLMGQSDAFKVLFDSQTNPTHVSCHTMRDCSIGDEFRSMKVACRYTYQYRVGRDDYESEYMTVRYKTNYDSCGVFPEKTAKSYLQDLLYDTIKKKYQGNIEIKIDDTEYIYKYRSWHDYNYGSSQKDFEYSEEECEKMKDDLINEINILYKQYFDDFIEAYKAFLSNEGKL